MITDQEIQQIRDWYKRLRDTLIAHGDNPALAPYAAMSLSGLAFDLYKLTCTNDEFLRSVMVIELEICCDELMVFCEVLKLDQEDHDYIRSLMQEAIDGFSTSKSELYDKLVDVRRALQNRVWQAAGNNESA